MRRLVIGLVVLLVAAAPAGADVIGRKQAVDTRISSLQERVAAAKEKEAALQREIDGVSTQIRGLERQVGDVSQRLAPLEHELELRELKLNKLNALLQVQTDRLRLLRADYRTAIDRLSRRLVAAYESDTPDQLSLLLSSRSFSEFLDGLDYVKLDRRERQADRRRGEVGRGTRSPPRWREDEGRAQRGACSPRRRSSPFASTRFACSATS